MQGSSPLLLFFLGTLACSELLVDVPVTVRRLHSRQRRFIAPGSRWDILLGFESIGDDFEARFDIVIKYELDYLFGGTAALQAAIDAANAAALAFEETEAAVLASAGRRRRLNARMSRQEEIGDETEADNDDETCKEQYFHPKIFSSTLDFS